MERTSSVGSITWLGRIFGSRRTRTRHEGEGTMAVALLMFSAWSPRLLGVRVNLRGFWRVLITLYVLIVAWQADKTFTRVRRDCVAQRAAFDRWLALPSCETDVMK